MEAHVANSSRGGWGPLAGLEKKGRLKKLSHQREKKKQWWQTLDYTLQKTAATATQGGTHDVTRPETLKS